MSEDPDLERRLEAMFASTGPRRGFEDELWRRIEARRPWHQRLGRRFQPALRYAPALATLLVVALGVTWFANSFHGSLTSSPSTTSAGAPAYSSEKASSFGVLPQLPGGLRSATAPQATTGNADTSAGINFTGTLPSLPSALPVYRYDEPSAADRATAAATLHAQTGLAVVVTPSDSASGTEPEYLLSGPAPNASQADPAGTAADFLRSHNLAPRFPFQLHRIIVSGQRVVYQRGFDSPARAVIPQVRPNGAEAGLSVDLAGGSVTARGPLDLPLTSATYPLRSAGEALAATNVRQGPGSSALDHAELVYVLVVSGGHGYYEPELLLSGPRGTVLAPLIATTWLGA